MLVCPFGFLKKRFARKLRRIILLQFGPVTFKFHFKINSKKGFILQSWNLGKDWGPTNPNDPSNKLFKILNMGSISSRKHEMGIW